MMSLTRLAAGVALAALALLPSPVFAEEVIDLTPPTLAPEAPKGEVPKAEEPKADDSSQTRIAEPPRDQPASPPLMTNSSDSSSSHEVDSQPMLQTRHFGAQIELECAVARTPSDLLLVNRGFDPLPPGTRIKWQLKGAGLVGYFAIIGELEPGQTLVADNVVNGAADRNSACVARAI
jgi:hypothetical protein